MQNTNTNTNTPPVVEQLNIRQQKSKMWTMLKNMQGINQGKPGDEIISVSENDLGLDPASATNRAKQNLIIPKLPKQPQRKDTQRNSEKPKLSREVSSSMNPKNAEKIAKTISFNTTETAIKVSNSQRNSSTLKRTNADANKSNVATMIAKLKGLFA